jgi:hypothetical protein
MSRRPRRAGREPRSVICGPRAAVTVQFRVSIASQTTRSDAVGMIREPLCPCTDSPSTRSGHRLRRRESGVTRSGTLRLRSVPRGTGRRAKGVRRERSITRRDPLRIRRASLAVPRDSLLVLREPLGTPSPPLLVLCDTLSTLGGARRIRGGPRRVRAGSLVTRRGRLWILRGAVAARRAPPLVR